jgi:23S rRNA (adenine2503-C2)-methyltransferase
LRATDWHGQRRLTLEYIMCRGLNDSAAHARELARRFRGLRCRINLIPFHGGTGLPFTASGWEQMERFQQCLKDEGFITHIRRSRGQDIAAACGQLTSGRTAE